jgi:hypothetical protein
MRIEGYALLSRAWIFQERLLSRRVLHFGFDEVFWECIETTDCQCPSMLDDSDAGGHIKSSWYKHLVSGAQLSQKNIWHRMVEFYTTLKLTYTSDRQAAILGLARQMEPYRHGVYLAGLWEDTLIADLAWTVEWPSNKDKSCPTWSWASANSPVEYRNTSPDRDVEIVAIDQPSQALGASTATNDKRRLGLVTLQGMVFTGTSDNSHNYHRYNAKGATPKHTWVGKSLGGGFKDIYGRRAFFFPDVEFITPLLPDGEAVFCLAIGFDGTVSQRFDVGLVLRCVDEGAQLYERLGIVRVEGGGAEAEGRSKRGGFNQFQSPAIKTITLI